MIISVEAEKTFDKMYCLFIIKTLHELGVEVKLTELDK